LICEILEFDPTSLVIELDRVVGEPDEVIKSKREKARCHTYTFPEISQMALEAGFDEVIPISVPIDHPWQIVLIKKSNPS